MKAEPVDPYYRLSSVSDRLPSAAPIELPPVDTEIANTFALHPIIVQGVRNEFRQTVHLFMRIPDPEAEQLEHFMHGVSRDMDLLEKFRMIYRVPHS